jgi:ankyrin repeat protein
MVDDSDKSDIQHGEIDVVNKCRKNGASPLAIACEYGHTEIVEMLLEYKADINKCQTECETPRFHFRIHRVRSGSPTKQLYNKVES